MQEEEEGEEMGRILKDFLVFLKFLGGKLEIL